MLVLALGTIIKIRKNSKDFTSVAHGLVGASLITVSNGLSIVTVGKW